MTTTIEVAKANRDRFVGAMRNQEDRAARRIARGLRDSFTRLRGALDEDELVRLIDRRQINEILRIYNNASRNQGFDSFRQAMNQAFIDAGQRNAEELGSVPARDGGSFEAGFNALDPGVAEFVEQNTARQVREIDSQTRDMIRETVAQGLRQGRNPRQVAGDLKGSIGLTRRQRAAVARYRQELEAGDPRALDRALRDKRSDSSVRRAIRQGEPLPQKQIDSLTERYRQRYIAFRAETIARTEAIRAINGSQHQHIRRLIADGSIHPRQVRREWVYTPDSRTRDHHLTVPSLNEGGVGPDEPFVTELGPLRFPGDPRGQPANVINCRCTVFPRILSAELVGLA